MRKNFIAGMLMIGVPLFYSCSNTVGTTGDNKLNGENKISQQEDGTISLKVDKAECYQDKVNPSSNTAEWSVIVSKSGRYNVWLSSATRDTTDLKYKNSVKLNILDSRLEARPACDKIFQSSTDVTYPYFRADSFMGSLYIQDTGVYYIQVISEKIKPEDYQNNEISVSDNSKLLSVFLTPITQ
jgi:hypothetical protein